MNYQVLVILLGCRTAERLVNKDKPTDKESWAVAKIISIQLLDDEAQVAAYELRLERSRRDIPILIPHDENEFLMIEAGL